VIHLDGSDGEGGGQILRTALGLSAWSGQPFSIHSIRANRAQPGMMRQHLTAVQAVATVCRAEVEGDRLGSRSLVFRPARVVPGPYRFDIGTAGSTTLVLQALLPPLLTAAGSSRIVITGGTHNPHAPPTEFLAKSFLPLLRRCGPEVHVRLRRPGFYPAGGGEIEVEIAPRASLQPLELLAAGALRSRRATARVANLDVSIAKREIRVVSRELGLGRHEGHTEELSGVAGAGNVVSIEHEFEHVTDVSTGFGRRGVPAEKVARQAALQAREVVEHAVPVGTHLADQLLIPLAMAGGGCFRTVEPSLHTRTNATVIGAFLPVRFSMHPEGDGRWRIEASSGA